MRDDFLASVAVVDEGDPRAILAALTAIHQQLATRFRYFELIYAVSESRRGTLAGLAGEFGKLTNLRTILIREGAGFYRRRAIAAGEMIGDVAALIDPAEVTASEVADLLIQSRDSNRILIGWRPVQRSAHLTYRLLSLLSRNLVSAQSSRTIILPRSELDALTARRNLPLDLRFEPRDAPSAFAHFEITRKRSAKSGLGERYQLLMEILRSGAPRYLKAYAATGFVVFVGALFYAVYAVAVWALRSEVQPGWFSTAVVLSGSTAFIAAGMSIVAIALSAALESLSGGDERMVLDEFVGAGLFDAAQDRNVELTPARSEADKGPVGA